VCFLYPEIVLEHSLVGRGFGVLKEHEVLVCMVEEASVGKDSRILLILLFVYYLVGGHGDGTGLLVGLLCRDHDSLRKKVGMKRGSGGNWMGKVK